MPILFGINHKVPRKAPCEKCGHKVRLECLDEMAVYGKFLAFAGVCKACGAYKWTGFGELEYIKNFEGMIHSPEFQKLLSEFL